MGKETFDQMIARVTAKKSAGPKSTPPPAPPKLSPSPVAVPSPGPKLK